jgi:hypothetical protein
VPLLIAPNGCQACAGSNEIYSNRYYDTVLRADSSTGVSGVGIAHIPGALADCRMIERMVGEFAVSDPERGGDLRATRIFRLSRSFMS